MQTSTRSFKAINQISNAEAPEDSHEPTASSADAPAVTGEKGVSSEFIAQQKEFIEEQRRLMHQQAKLIEERSKLIEEKKQFLAKQSEMIDSHLL